MKNTFVVLVLTSLLLTPLAAVQPRQQQKRTQEKKESKLEERRTLKRFLCWIGLGAASALATPAARSADNHRIASLRQSMEEDQAKLRSINQELKQIDPEQYGSGNALYGLNVERERLESSIAKSKNDLELSSLPLSLLASGVAVAACFKAYKNFPDKQARLAAWQRLRETPSAVWQTARRSPHLCKAMGYGLTGLSMGIASAGIVALGGLHATLNIHDLDRPGNAFYGVATAAVAWHYLLPIIWTLSKEYRQAAREEWAKFRNREQNNVQPTSPAPIAAPAA